METVHAMLLRNLDEAFEGPAWHGSALVGAIRRVTPDEAAWRPAPDRHCIWDLVLHTAYWKYAVRRRLTGTKRGGFARKGSNFFPLPDRADAAALRADVKLLHDEHAQLRAVVAELAESSLGRKVAGSKWSNETMIQGVAFHDIYHAGQIQLLKRLRAGAVAE
jgi:hypothetical protein